MERNQFCSRWKGLDSIPPLICKIIFVYSYSYFISIETETQNIKNKETTTKMEEVQLKVRMNESCCTT